MARGFIVMPRAGFVIMLLGVMNPESRGEWISGGRGWKYSNADTNFYPWSTACKIGIGTTGPLSKLHVPETTGSDIISWPIWAANERHSSPGTGMGTGIKFKLDSNPAGYPHKWAGIAGIQTAGYATKTGLAFYTTADGDNTAPDEKVRIDHAGNVGIGTTGPEAKLDVVGDIKATGTINADEYDGQSTFDVRRFKLTGQLSDPAGTSKAFLRVTVPDATSVLLDINPIAWHDANWGAITYGTSVSRVQVTIAKEGGDRGTAVDADITTVVSSGAGTNAWDVTFQLSQVSNDATQAVYDIKVTANNAGTNIMYTYGLLRVATMNMGGAVTVVGQNGVIATEL